MPTGTKATALQNSGERKNWLPHLLELYNDRRCNVALGGLGLSSASPSCLQNDLVGNHS
jgi:hypothetical protein